jgi:uncharacterized protein involved in exopolysaccharide biosynthesis
MDVKAPTPIREEEIRLRDLLEELWRTRWIACAVTALFIVAAAGAAWLIPKSYKASVVLLPATNAPGSQLGGGLGSLMSEIGGLASLAGLSAAGDAKKTESIAVLQSDALTERYIEQNRLLPVLYAKLWDPQGRRWKVSDPQKVPTLWKADQFFKKSVRSVTTEMRTGLVTMTVVWDDPHVAATWANGLVKMTNDFLRAKAIEESQRNIAYLSEQAGKTDVVGVKQAIYTILQNEIDKEMLARGTEEYALKIVDPAIAPETPYSPRPMLWVLLAAATGLLVSIFIAFLRLTWSRA